MFTLWYKNKIKLWTSQEEDYMNNKDENKKGIQLHHNDKINEKKKIYNFVHLKMEKLVEEEYLKKFPIKFIKK